MEEFSRQLDRRGGRIERWTEREAARAFVEREPEAARELARAERLEYALDLWRAPESSPDLRRRLASIPALEPRRRGPAWLQALRGLGLGLGGGWRTAGGLAAMFAFGFAAGLLDLDADTLAPANPIVEFEGEVVTLALGLLEETG